MVSEVKSINLHEWEYAHHPVSTVLPGTIFSGENLTLKQEVGAGLVNIGFLSIDGKVSKSTKIDKIYK